MNTQIQQVYTIHQHHLSRDGQIALDCRGWKAAEDHLEIEAYVTKAEGALKFKPEFWQFYTPAIKVAADSLDQVFSAGNGFGRFADSVEKLGPAYSCSVGDIIQCGGLYWMVDPHGFSEITEMVKKAKTGFITFIEDDHICTAESNGICVCGAWMDPAGTVHQSGDDPAMAYE
jgi:hypothetical protein